MRIVVKHGAYYNNKIRISTKVFPGDYPNAHAWSAGGNKIYPRALLTMSGDFEIAEVETLVSVLQETIRAAKAGEGHGHESGVGNELEAEATA